MTLYGSCAFRSQTGDEFKFPDKATGSLRGGNTTLWTTARILLLSSSPKSGHEILILLQSVRSGLLGNGLWRVKTWPVLPSGQSFWRVQAMFLKTQRSCAGPGDDETAKKTVLGNGTELK